MDKFQMYLITITHKLTSIYVFSSMNGMNTKLLVLVALLTLTSLTDTWAADASTQILSGSKFVQEKKYDDAVREFEAAISLDPQNAEAYLLAGLTYAAKKELDLAIDRTQKSIVIKPSYSAYNNLGLIYSNKGQFQNGIDAYENALKLNPKSYTAWHQLGKLASSNANFQRSIEAFRQAVELNPKFPEAYQGLGSAYYMEGDMTLALQQVGQLERLQFLEQAKELEKWIKDKEAKKTKALKKISSKTETPAA